MGDIRVIAICIHTKMGTVNTHVQKVLLCKKWLH